MHFFPQNCSILKKKIHLVVGRGVDLVPFDVSLHPSQRLQMEQKSLVLSWVQSERVGNGAGLESGVHTTNRMAVPH